MTPEDGERGLPKASSIAICSGSPGLSFAADSALQQSWLKADLLVDKPIRAEVLRNDVDGLLNRAAILTAVHFDAGYRGWPLCWQDRAATLASEAGV